MGSSFELGEMRNSFIISHLDMPGRKARRFCPQKYFRLVNNLPSQSRLYV